ncbi:MAG: DUF1365 domain-containing protein [Leptothrix sp. (in: b-proteobacteria)]
MIILHDQPSHAAAPAAAQAQIGVGQVRHTRLAPVRHDFSYPTWFLLLPMRAWRAGLSDGPARNRAAPVSFHDRDHGDGGPDALAWFEALLGEAGIDDADGEVWLHTYPRVLGYAFKPVSFWYAHRADGSLTAIVAEVNNTFGERHCYLLAGPQLAWGREMQADKVFHVSPFCAVAGRYRFRFVRTPADAGHPERTLVRIDHDGPDGPLLQTSVSGALQPYSAAALRRTFLRNPLLTLGLIARIHWQAWQLWRKRVPFWRKPAPPVQPLTR